MLSSQTEIGQVCWSQVPGSACAADAMHEYYVVSTFGGTFRYFVWVKRAPRQIVAWGEEPTIEDAKTAAEANRSGGGSP